MTTVVITQPMLFPWPGMFEQLSMADILVYLDDAQFVRTSFTNRVQLLERHKQRWLTIPIARTGVRQNIDCIEAADENWRAAHQSQVELWLASAPYSAQSASLLRGAYEEQRVSEILIRSMRDSAKLLGIGTNLPTFRSSAMRIRSRSSQRILDLVLAVGGTRYLTGHGAVNYLDHLAFENAGVAVDYVDYSLTTWPRNGSQQTPFLSVLDLLAWTGPDAPDFVHARKLAWREFLARRAGHPGPLSRS